jgi:hypothetical protein
MNHSAIIRDEPSNLPFAYAPPYIGLLSMRYFDTALGEFATSGLGVTLIRAGGVEVAATPRAQDAARKRAHALWERIGSVLKQRRATFTRPPRKAQAAR